MDACQRDSILDQSTDPSRDLKLDPSLHRKLMETARATVHQGFADGVFCFQTEA